MARRATVAGLSGEAGADAIDAHLARMLAQAAQPAFQIETVRFSLHAPSC